MVSAFAQGCGGQGEKKIYRSRRFGFFSREKKFSPSPRTIYPCRVQRLSKKAAYFEIGEFRRFLTDKFNNGGNALKIKQNISAGPGEEMVDFFF